MLGKIQMLTLSLAIIGHFHEGEPSGLSRVAVCYNVYTVNRSIPFKQGSNRVFGSAEAQVSYKNILHLTFLSEICRTANRRTG